MFDPRGRLVEVCYLDLVGQPTLSKDGYARRTLGYDALGNPPTEEAFFDEAGKPTLSKDGYAGSPTATTAPVILLRRPISIRKESQRCPRMATPGSSRLMTSVVM